MKSPDPRNFASIVAALRQHGSVLWPADAITGDFLEWRRRIRAAARTAELRISVRRVHGLVLIDHVDHVVTEDQITAFGTRVLAAVGAGADKPPSRAGRASHSRSRTCSVSPAASTSGSSRSASATTPTSAHSSTSTTTLTRTLGSSSASALSGRSSRSRCPSTNCGKRSTAWRIRSARCGSWRSRATPGSPTYRSRITKSNPPSRANRGSGSSRTGSALGWRAPTRGSGPTAGDHHRDAHQMDHPTYLVR
jgi:hypothetical protein